MTPDIISNNASNLVKKRAMRDKTPVFIDLMIGETVPKEDESNFERGGGVCNVI